MIAVITVFHITAEAQDKRLNQLEIGAGYAPFFLASADDSYAIPFKADLYCEWRHNLGRFFDVGAKLDYKLYPVSIVDRYAGFTYKGLQLYGALLASLGFNLGLFDNVGLFAGVGIGSALILNDWVAVSYDNPRDAEIPQRGLENPDYLFVAVPRVGVELFNHLRLSASVDLSLADTRWPLCFAMGWTF